MKKNWMLQCKGMRQRQWIDFRSFWLRRTAYKEKERMMMRYGNSYEWRLFDLRAKENG